MKKFFSALAGALVVSFSASAADVTVSVRDAVVSKVGNDTVFVFTNKSSYAQLAIEQVNGSFEWECLVVGGGGAGGAVGGGGGGGGGVLYRKLSGDYRLQAGDFFRIDVGRGAPAIVPDNTTATYTPYNSRGEDSVLYRNGKEFSRAFGGGSGASWNNLPQLEGVTVSSTGGASKKGKAGGRIPERPDAQGHEGGAYVDEVTVGTTKYKVYAAGGGGGAASEGQAPTNTPAMTSIRAGAGGCGVTNDITGAALIYGSGGGAGFGDGGVAARESGNGGPNAGNSSESWAYDGRGYNYRNAVPGFGGGGAGGSYQINGTIVDSGFGTGGAGGSGVVVIRINGDCFVNYRWPELESGYGDLLLNGETGWKGARPDYSNSDTYFTTNGDYTAELTRGSLRIYGTCTIRSDAGHAAVGADGNARLTFNRVDLGTPSGTGLAELKVGGTNAFVDVESALAVKGHGRLVVTEGGTLTTRAFTTRIDAAAGSEVQVRHDGRWNAGSVEFGSASDPASAPAIHLLSDGGVLDFAGDVSFGNPGSFLFTNGTFAVAAGRSVRVAKNARLDFQGGTVDGGDWVFPARANEGGGLVLGAGVRMRPGNFSFGGVAGANPVALTVEDGAVFDTPDKPLAVATAADATLAVSNATVRVQDLVLGQTGGGGQAVLKLGLDGVVEAGRVLSRNLSKTMVTSDGGVFRAAGCAQGEAFLSSLPTVFCVGSGLAIDTAGHDAAASFAVTGDGYLQKDGEGTLTYSGAKCGVPGLVVRGGAFVPGPGADLSSCVVTVEAGGVFSTVGATTEIAVKGLTVNAGTIRVDAGDTLVVDGPLTLVAPTVAFSALPERDQAVSVLVVNGSVSEEAKNVWRKALIANGLPTGFGATFDAQTAGARTTFRVTLFEAAHTQWTGEAGDGKWETAGNWTDGVPSAEKFASFTAAAPKTTEVELPKGASALSLEFSGAGYALTGGSLTLVDSGRNPRIDVSAGSTNVIASSLNCQGLVKSGEGFLTLSGSSAVDGDFVLEEGVLKLARSDAAGTGGRLVLSNGTLTVSEGLGLVDKTVLLPAGCVAAFENAGSVVFTDPATEGGTLVKRGGGTLQFATAGHEAVVPAVTVEEGRLAFVASPNDPATFRVAGALVNGSGEGAVEAAVQIENATVVADRYAAGENRTGEAGSLLVLSGARLIVTNGLALAGVSAGAATNRVLATDSTLFAEDCALAVESALDARFENSRVAATDGLVAGAGATGRLVIGEGSVFEALGVSVRGALARPFRLAFDGGAWDVTSASGDVVVGEGQTGDLLAVESLGRNRMLEFVVADGRRLVFSGLPVVGAGGLNVTGGGTVRFEAGTFRLDPGAMLKAEDGVLDCSKAGASINQPRLLPGDGVFRGAIFRSARIVLDGWYGARLPTFDSCTFGGSTYVSVESTVVRPVAPFTLQVCRCQNMNPDLSTWNVAFGDKTVASFTLTDGIVVGSVNGAGLFFIIQ